MWQFLQTYGIWIVLGVVFILMMRMCGGGMHGSRGGCGMDMGQSHDQNEEQAKAPRVVPFPPEERDDQRVLPPEAAYTDAERKALVRGEYAEPQRETLVRDVPPREESAPPERSPADHRSRGC